MSLRETIRTRVSSSIAADPFFSSGAIPVFLFDYDIESMIKAQLQQTPIGIQINLIDITSLQASYDNSYRQLQLAGVIEVYEEPTLNRTVLPVTSSVEVAEQIIGCLDNQNLSDINLTRFDVKSCVDTTPKKAPDQKGPTIVRQTIKYELIRPLITSRT